MPTHPIMCQLWILRVTSMFHGHWCYFVFADVSGLWNETCAVLSIDLSIIAWRHVQCHFVLFVRHGAECWLVPGYFKRWFQLCSHVPLISGLSHKRLDAFFFVPPLLFGYFWQICSTVLLPFRIIEFKDDTMDTDFPIKIVLGIFEIFQQWDGAGQMLKFCMRNGLEPSVFQGADHCIFRKSGVNVLGFQCTDAST